MMRVIILLTIALWSFQLSAQQTVGTILNNSGTYEGFTLFTARQYHTSYLINNEGRKINEWAQANGDRVENCRLLENGQLIRSVNLLLPFYNGKPGAHGKLELVNWDGSVDWSMTYADSTHVLHHDVVPILQNDSSYHFLVSTWDVVPGDTAIAHGRNPSAVGGSSNFILVERILEIEPVGTSNYNIIWEWSVMDHLVQEDYPSAGNYISSGVVNNPQLFHFNYFKNTLPSTLTISDWMHVSGLDYNSSLDQIVFSHHGANELIIIDHSTTIVEAAGHTGGSSGMGGDILYRWGNPRTYDVMAPNHFQALHSPHWIPDTLVHGGKLMVLNNGFNSGSSSIDILTPPVDITNQYVIPATGTAFGPINLDWSYSNGSDFHTGNMGNGQRLPNGNTLINEAVKGWFFEIDTNNTIVWKYRCPTIASGPMVFNVDTTSIPTTNPSGDLENEVFRIYKYPLNYSGFDGEDLTPGDFVEVNNPLTIDDLNKKEDALVIYPNPTSGKFIITGEFTNSTIQVLSMDGKQIQVHTTKSNSVELDISNQAAGLFFIKVINNETGSISFTKVNKW